MTIMLSKSPPFNSWIWKYTLCRLAAGCQNQSNLKSEPEIWWTSRNCNHSVPNGRSVAPIKKSFRTIPYLSHMWLASRRLLHIIFIDNDNRQPELWISILKLEMENKGVLQFWHRYIHNNRRRHTSRIYWDTDWYIRTNIHSQRWLYMLKCGSNGKQRVSTQ